MTRGPMGLEGLEGPQLTIVAQQVTVTAVPCSTTSITSTAAIIACRVNAAAISIH